MHHCFLLQDEFTNWLEIRNEALCLKPFFYTSQITKLNEIPFFLDAERSVLDVLENEILCDHHKGVEEILLKTLSKMEQMRLQTDITITRTELDGLRMGFLKYRLFLHDFMASRSINYKRQHTALDYLSEIKQVNLETLFKENINYSIPIYHDVYTYQKNKIDALWQVLLNANNSEETEDKEQHPKRNDALETIVVKVREEKQLEVLDGGNTLMMLSILRHVLTEFSEGENDSVTSKAKVRRLSRKCNIETKLNEQSIFRVLLSHGINKEATTVNEISKGVVYNYKELGLNNGFHFLQTTFRLVQLIQEARIPQSENYIVNMDAFITKTLKTTCITRQQLSPENSDKTYLNTSILLLKNLMEWL